MVDTVGTKSEKVIHLNKTHGAMIRFASAEDEDLKIVMAVLLEMIEEIVENEKREAEPGQTSGSLEEQQLSLNK